MLSRELTFTQRAKMRRSPKRLAIKWSYQVIEIILLLLLLSAMTVEWI